MSLAEKLQMLRINKRLSQEELANILEVSRQAVSKWESAKSAPDLQKLLKLSELYNVSIDALVKDDIDLEEEGNLKVNNEDVLEYEDSNKKQIIINFYNNSFEYEYKSKKELFGLPLVHINIGRGIKKAKGIIAIGNISFGLISVGLISIGILSFGILSLALFSLAVLSIGLLLAVGAISVGIVSIGAISIGIFSIGAFAIGKYAVGASAIASNVAIGDYAKATNIAIGNSAVGKERIILDKYVSIDKVIVEIKREYPNLSDFVIKVMESVIRNLSKITL
jgi:transcriptional regulator with XRE-family HTH domain